MKKGLKKNRLSHKVVVLTYPQIDMLELATPLEVFHLANLSLEDAKEKVGIAYDVTLIGVGSSKLIQTGCGVPVTVSQTIQDFRGRIDTLIVPGGEVWGLRDDPLLLKRLSRLMERASRVESICTGAFLLADAGVLNGKTATTHWRACEMLQQRFPDIDVQEDALFVQQGKPFTSAGSTAGIDLMLHLVQQLRISSPMRTGSHGYSNSRTWGFGPKQRTANPICCGWKSSLELNIQMTGIG